VQNFIRWEKMLEHVHDVIQLPNFNFRPGMQDENEKLESFEESHALPVDRTGNALILFQKCLTDGDLAFEASQADGVIHGSGTNLHIVEIDGSHAGPQERAQEQP